ncbi:MAG: hypothetical protein R3C54_13585 [Parvularculaceae bacterium]
MVGGTLVAMSGGRRGGGGGSRRRRLADGCGGLALRLLLLRRRRPVIRSMCLISGTTMTTTTSINVGLRQNGVDLSDTLKVFTGGIRHNWDTKGLRDRGNLFDLQVTRRRASSALAFRLSFRSARHRLRPPGS